MKSGPDYKLRMVVRSQPRVGPEVTTVEKFLWTECSCPAGKGPHATCKHLSALLYALEEFSRLGYARETVTCTGRLQMWNQPRNKNEKVMKLTDMDWRRPSLSRQCFDAMSRKKLQASELTDPCALDKRGTVGERVHTIV